MFYSFEISAFPKKKDALIKEKINKNDYEVLLETGHHLFFIEYCNYSNSPNDRKFYKNIKGLIAYTNWNLFLIFNAGYQDINKKIDQDKRLRKAKLNWMYGFRDCEINSLNKGYEAIDNLFEIIIEYLIEHNQEEYQNNLSKLISLLEEDKKDDYSLVINELKKRVDEKLGFKDDTAKKNQEIEDSQIEKADNSETNNQLDLTETEDLPQNKVDNELIVSLEEAKQVLILIQEFLPSNPTEFDIVALTTLIQKNKEVLQDSWSNEQQDNFRELYDFLFQSDAFSNFKIAKDEETRKAKEEAIKQERVSLNQNISLLKDYLTQNMFADDAPQVLEMIAKGESLQSSDDIEELKTINEKISIFLKKKDIEQLDIQKSNKNSNSDIKENIKDVLNIFDKEDDNNDQSNIEDNKTVELEKNNLVESSYVNFEDENVYGPCVFDICLYDKLETVIKNKKTSNCEYKNLEGVCEGLRCWKKDEIKKNLVTRSYDGKWCEHGESSMFSPIKVDLSLIFEMDDETNNILGSNFFEFQHALIINDKTFSAFKKIKSYCGLPFRFQGRFVSNGGHSVIITALPDEKMEYFISDIFVQFNNFNEKVQTFNGHSEYQLKIFDSLIKRYETTFLNIRGQYDSYEDPDDYSRDDDALIIKDRLFQDNKSYNIRMWDGFDRNKLWGSPKHKMPAELLITNDIRYTTYNLPGDLTEVDLNAVMSSEEWNYLTSVYSKINQSEYCKELSEGPEVDLN